jgi:hypothetical protein
MASCGPRRGGRLRQHRRRLVGRALEETAPWWEFDLSNKICRGFGPLRVCGAAKRIRYLSHSSSEELEYPQKKTATSVEYGPSSDQVTALRVTAGGEGVSDRGKEQTSQTDKSPDGDVVSSFTRRHRYPAGGLFGRRGRRRRGWRPFGTRSMMGSRHPHSRQRSSGIVKLGGAVEQEFA